MQELRYFCILCLHEDGLQQNNRGNLKKYKDMKFTKEGPHSRTEKHSIQTSIAVHFKMKQAHGQLSHKQISWVVTRV